MNRRSLVFGLLCCPVGLAVGGHVAYIATGKGREIFPLHAGAAALITSALLWWLIMERPRRRGIARGVFVGALSGLLAHYVCWYFTLIEFNVGYWIFHNTARYASSLGEEPLDLISGIWRIWIFTFWSWFFYGWVTAPAGGIIGGLYAWYLGRKRGTKDAIPNE